ncbi:MAG TPA: polysaccharide deacetylase family protein [Terriglobales bacterium]|jgi:peptidoglycan-N-acetylglucosamine deacetylase|nr:polysaccharide deacetylase family protein [Terriglobales bacterium]
MTSRRILIWVILLPVFAASTTLAQSVAITFDDLPLNGELPPGMTRAQMVKDVVAILKRRKTPQIFGFVNAKKLEGNPDGAAALKEWVGGGERVGNHTYSHIDLQQNTAEAFERDLAQNEPVLELLSPADDWHWLRYPFLREGDTLDKRRAVRKYLSDHGYKVAQVTIDYEDYAWNNPYARCAAKQDAKSMEWLISNYLSLASDYIDGDRAMAQLVYGHDINHVLLLHLGAFSSTIVPQVLDMLHAKHLRLVTLEEAESDPAYQVDPNAPTSRFGASLLEQMMNVKRLPYPKLPPKPFKQLESLCR